MQDIGRARADPELFLRLNPPPLVLDEVQNAPELLAAVKRAVDERPGETGLYFLTGSQQLNMLGRVQESLAGRVALVDLFPMTVRELAGQGESTLLLETLLAQPEADAVRLLGTLRAAARPRGPTDLVARLFRGGYPGLMALDDGDLPVWFASYLRTYVERDLRLLQDVTDPHDLGRFLRLLAALSGQELNAAHLGREIGISPPTARRWLSALEHSFLAWRLDAWSGNVVKRVSGRPKMHLVDTGLTNHLLTITSPTALSGHPNLGSIFESHVALEIRKQAAAMAAAPALWHWRSHGGAEVDLIIERDGVMHPIEIKLSARVSRRNGAGLAAFAESSGARRVGTRIIIHAGADLEAVDEQTLAVPVDLL